jgi:coenzyme Q-binding protein COQ10
MLRSLRNSVQRAKAAKPLAHTHTHTLTRTLPVPVPIAYQVVADVASYHLFIPYCTDSFVNERDALGEPREAGLRVGFQGYDEQFVCHLECLEGSEVPQVLATSASHALFHHLHTKWRFHSIAASDEHCRVSLELSYRFKSRVYHSASGVFGPSVSELVMRAFDKRAREVFHASTASNDNT